MSPARVKNGFWQTGFFIAVVIVAVWAVNRSRVSAEHSQRLFNQSQVEINTKIVQSQLNGCIRGHSLRAQVNFDTDLIRTFMLAAVKATKAKPTVADQKRAALYQRLADGLKDVAQPDCNAVIYRPGTAH